MRIAQAIVRAPAPNFAAGIASVVGGGDPDVAAALQQHAGRCVAGYVDILPTVFVGVEGDDGESVGATQSRDS